MARKAIDLSGQRFGRLIVIRLIETDIVGAVWKCRCDCGNEVDVRASCLRSGNTRSCGCLIREVDKKIHTKHGKSDSRLYPIWSSMKDRCYNSKHRSFKHYGSRGITVCDEWLHDFNSFYEWAMASGYDENAPRGQYTLDRIDNDKGYSPDNCRWVTIKEQQNNRRSSRMITFNSETHTMYEWAKILGMPYKTLNNRINWRRWSIEKALTQPTK